MNLGTWLRCCVCVCNVMCLVYNNNKKIRKHTFDSAKTQANAINWWIKRINPKAIRLKRMTTPIVHENGIWWRFCVSQFYYVYTMRLFLSFSFCGGFEYQCLWFFVFILLLFFFVYTKLGPLKKVLLNSNSVRIVYTNVSEWFYCHTKAVKQSKHTGQ